MRNAASHPTGPQRRASRAALRLVVAGLLAAGLAGCKSYTKEVRGWMLADPAVRHPIEVSEREVGLDLVVTRSAYGLTRAQKHDARDFVRRYKQESDGRLLVRAPSSGPNEVAALQALDDLRDVLRAEGVPPRAVAFEPYYSGGDPRAPVQISYLRLVAQGPDCGRWPTDLGRDGHNVPYHNFGCAMQRNLAATIANPRDLIEPRGMTPRSSERRDVIWDKWIKGEPTGAEKAEDEKAKSSEVQGGGN